MQAASCCCCVVLAVLSTAAIAREHEGADLEPEQAWTAEEARQAAPPPLATADSCLLVQVAAFWFTKLQATGVHIHAQGGSAGLGLMCERGV